MPSRSFSGLTNLRRLALNSRNSEWSSVVMEVDRDALRNLRRLEEVDFSGNNLWSLPSGVFCNSPDLRSANLSRNHLLHVADAGLAEMQEGGIPCQVRP